MGAIWYDLKGQTRSCADNGAPGSPVGAMLNALGALKVGAHGQGGSSGAICKSDLKAPKVGKLATVLSAPESVASLHRLILMRQFKPCSS